MESHGLYPFSWEANHNPSEFFNQKSRAIEYSFFGWNSSFMNPIVRDLNEVSSSTAETKYSDNLNPEEHLVIVFLARSSKKDIHKLKKSISSVGTAFNGKKHRIVVYYDDEDFLKWKEELLATAASSGLEGDLEFAYIKLELPEGFCNFQSTFSKRTQFWYHYMIRF